METIQSLADELLKAAEQSEAVKHVSDHLVGGSPDSLELRRSPRSGDLRGHVYGAFVRSHKGLEPLEDAGYPKRPVSESGFILTVAPKGTAAALLPEVSLGCLIGVKDDRLTIALCLAVKDAGADGYSDLVPGTQGMFRGRLDDPAPLRDALEYVKGTLLQAFVDQIVLRLGGG